MFRGLIKKLIESPVACSLPKTTIDTTEDHPVLRARLLEDMYVEGGIPGIPSIPPDHIINVTVGFNPDKNFVVLFETKQYRYGIVVVLSSHRGLSWKECQALSDAMTLAERDTSADNRQFKDWHSKLVSKYRDCSLAAQNQRLLMALNPGNPKIRFKPGSIQTNNFEFEDNKAIFKLTTSSHEYEICVVLLSPHLGAGCSIMECKCLADLFKITETGDLMTPDTFLRWCVKLVSKYNLVKVNKAPRGYYAEIVPTILEDQAVLSPVLVEWIDQQKRAAAVVAAAAKVGGAPKYDGFDIETLLVESGQATVYRGRQTSTGAKVAIKVYKSASDLEEYTVEMKALSKLGDHPNVVGLMGYFERPRPCIVMEFIEGLTLRKFLDKHGALPESRAVPIALGMAKGLAHLHKEGFVHRDVKSLNVMISDSETPILIDMGLGKDVGKMESTMVLKSDHVKGTICWMSPEMMLDSKYSRRSDTYAFGIMMWEILSGRYPFEEHQGIQPIRLMQAIQNPRKPLRPNLARVPSSAPSYLIELAKACWQHSDEARPKMREVVRALEARRWPLPASIEFKKKKLIEKEFAEQDLRKVGTLSLKQFILFVSVVEPAVSIPGAEALFSLIDQASSTSHEQKRLTLASILTFWRELEEKNISVVEKIRTISTFDGNPYAPTDARTGWGVEDVCSRLSGIGLECYVERFRRERIDGRALIKFEKEDLIRLGVVSELHRIRIQKMHLETSRFREYVSKAQKVNEINEKIKQKENERKKREEDEKRRKEEEMRRLEREIADRKKKEEEKRLQRIKALEDQIRDLQIVSREQKVKELRDRLKLINSSNSFSREQKKILLDGIQAEFDALSR